MLERLLETLFFCGGAALELETRHARPTTGKADRWTAVAITAPALPVANAIGRAVRGWLQASYGKGVLLVAAETEAGASPKAGASASSSEAQKRRAWSAAPACFAARPSAPSPLTR